MESFLFDFLPFIVFIIFLQILLQNANKGVDDMLKSGSGILENLRDQRNTIKGAQRRIMDIASTLGLSNTTMRLIERRAHEDKYILLGGMFVTLLIIILVVLYLT